MHLTMCSMDPGTNNYAYSIVKVKFDLPFRYQITKTGFVENVVYDMTAGVKKQAAAFKREIRSIVKEHKVDVMAAERYQNRGRMRGNTIELVNFMLGVLEQVNVQDYLLVTPVQWKNAFNRYYDLKDFYEEIPMEPHRIDATLIGLYGAHNYLDESQKPFSFLDDIKDLRILRKRLEATA